MKRVFLCLAGLLCLSLLPCLCACGKQEEPAGDKPEVVTTIFPLYDWVREITAGNEAVHLTLLQGNGADLHSFQPTVADIVAIHNARLFVYVGGESDEWVRDAVGEAGPALTALDLMDCLGEARKEEERKEGMEAQEEEESAYDEHIWLSVRNAQTLCRRICDALCAADADNAPLYRQNTDAYIQKLQDLDARFAEAAGRAREKTLLFASRFPFRYLTEDYGLDYFAAFPGCSAESEASFKTVVFLAGKIDELGLGTILEIDGSDGKLAETIRQNTASRDQQILRMNSLQTAGAQEAAAGLTYLDAMEENLDVLIRAMQ